MYSQQRMSFSKYNVNCMGDNSLYASLPSPNPLRRPRQNSVFVGSTVAVMNPPRRAKSAMDIQHMVLSDYSPGSLSGCSSLIPMVGTTKRPSITIETPQCPRHRASIVLEEPYFPPLQAARPSRNYLRRPSCLGERPRFARHRHFISFDQPTTSWDRRTSITVERPSRKILDFEQPSLDQPSLIIEPPSTVQEHPPTSISEEINLTGSCPGTVEKLLCQPSTSSTGCRRPSFHLETPSPNRHRLSVSLDHAPYRMGRRASDTRSLRYEPVSTSLDETKIQINLPENIQVSDV